MENRIILVAARYSTNLGDDVIFDVVESFCRDELNNIPVGISISGLADFRDNDVLIKKQQKKGLKRLLKRTRMYQFLAKLKGCVRIRKCLLDLKLTSDDIIIFAGGQLFYDYFSLLIYTIVKFANRKKAKVLFNCCGVGPINGISKLVLKKSFSRKCVKFISIRDGERKFKELFPELGNVQRLQDPAMRSCDIYTRKVKKDNKLGIGLISIENLKLRGIDISRVEYIEIIKNVLNVCFRLNKEFEFFTNGDIKDYVFLNEIVTELGYEKYIAERPRKAQELIEIIQRYDAIISFRLHSHIIASSYDIPSIGFVWDLKVRDFFHSINRQEWLIDLYKDVDRDELCEKVEKLISTKEYKTTSNLEDSCNVIKSVLSTL